MRRILLTTVAAVAIASPALAVPPAPPPPLYYGGPPGANSGFYSTNGIVGGIEIGVYHVWPDDEKDNFNIFVGEARGNLHLGNTWNILVETGGTAYWFDDGFSESAIGANAHFWKNAGNFRYGAFAGVNFNGLTFGRVGVEAEYDITSRITVGADLSYDFASPDDDDISILGLRAWWDYWFTPNTKLTGQAAYYDVDFDHDSESLWIFEKKLTHRINGTPFNVFGQLDYYRFEEDYDAWALGVGAAVTFGDGGTLQLYDRSVPFDALGGPQIIGVSLSDRRLKADIVKVGMLTPDIPLYRFRYLWGNEIFVGVMAQDLLAVRPDAVVVNDAGCYAVNYAALGTRMMRLDEWQATLPAPGKDVPQAESMAEAAG